MGESRLLTPPHVGEGPLLIFSAPAQRQPTWRLAGLIEIKEFAQERLAPAWLVTFVVIPMAFCNELIPLRPGPASEGGERWYGERTLDELVKLASI
jgi:hypothetical protein